MKQRTKISSPGNPFLYPGGRKAAGGVIGGAASQQGTTSGCIAYPGGSSSTFCCFSHRLRRRPPGVNVFTAARKPTPLISSFWDFVFARSTRRSDIICIRSITTSSIRFRVDRGVNVERRFLTGKNESSSRKRWISTILPPPVDPRDGWIQRSADARREDSETWAVMACVHDSLPDLMISMMSVRFMADDSACRLLTTITKVVLRRTTTLLLCSRFFSSFELTIIVDL